MKIPKGEKFLVTYIDKGRKFFITRCADGSGYMGYEAIGDKLVKVCKKKDPLSVEKCFAERLEG